MTIQVQDKVQAMKQMYRCVWDVSGMSAMKTENYALIHNGTKENEGAKTWENLFLDMLCSSVSVKMGFIKKIFQNHPRLNHSGQFFTIERSTFK